MNRKGKGKEELTSAGAFKSKGNRDRAKEQIKDGYSMKRQSKSG